MKFSEEDQKIDTDEYFKILAWLDKHLAVGVEMERPCSKNISEVATVLAAPLANHTSNRDLGRYKRAPCSKFNVNHVIEDGSVRNNSGSPGVEIVFCGTTESFNFIREKIHGIEKELDKLKCDDFDESCSNHISIVSLQDRVLSQTILKNILQITRAFSPGLYWLGSSSRTRVCRNGISNYASNLNEFTPIGKPIRELVAQGKHRACNMSKQMLWTIGEMQALSGLFVEFRNPDGMRVPTAIAANMMLFKAIVHKAVELSLRGVVNADTIVDWSKVKRLTIELMEYHNLNAAQKLALKMDVPENAKELLSFLSANIKRQSNEAYEVLQALAVKPISEHYSQGAKNWRDIEASISGRKPSLKLSKSEEKIVITIVNQEIAQGTASAQRVALAQLLNVSERMVEHNFKRIRDKTGKGIAYDSEVKRYVIE